MDPHMEGSDPIWRVRDPQIPMVLKDQGLFGAFGCVKNTEHISYSRPGWSLGSHGLLPILMKFMELEFHIQCHSTLRASPKIILSGSFRC